MNEHSGTCTPPLSVATIDGHLTERLYERFASVYDRLCGPLLHAGRREAMRDLPLKAGDEILEVGIGTGLTTSLYPDDCTVVGVDISMPMLREATKHIEASGRQNVRLRRMDAAALAFPDESFDVVYAAYVISVVPDPVAVLCEMRRVCRADGCIVLLNHFLSEGPVVSRLERLLSPLTARAGFRSDLNLTPLLAHAGLRAVAARKVNTPRIWSLVHCAR
jgi:phosphatidylethanolamine/phosphatidyl-N-methylethanolamine N-methyltransferase